MYSHWKSLETLFCTRVWAKSAAPFVTSSRFLVERIEAKQVLYPETKERTSRRWWSLRREKNKHSLSYSLWQPEVEQNSKLQNQPSEQLGIQESFSSFSVSSCLSFGSSVQFLFEGSCSPSCESFLSLSTRALPVSSCVTSSYTSQRQTFIQSCITSWQQQSFFRGCLSRLIHL